jgi:hypothetical protein
MHNTLFNLRVTVVDGSMQHRSKSTKSITACFVALLIVSYLVQLYNSNPKYLQKK